MSNPTTLSEQQMKQIATEAAKEAVTETFLLLGIDVTSPLEVQRDMAALRVLSSRSDDPEVGRDMTYLRELRLTSESIKSKTLLSFVGILVAGLVSAIVVGAKSIFSGDGG
ncbi:hypothetical protein HNR26_003866 [Rhizobium rosettiformans]|uniref:Uncharacterized protein n=2 Tax=Rhizobium rosettiformans TaxID=1368430 RepID=A0A4S8PXH3_9HYPH|nr:hypothetical protein [Rhizobium rosettiformans]MBB5277777.1 hypothetical protein [Rhizobium rosettiformans]THV32939.1 hypothetical protein FAA86_18790 [Rhizobium rosettiformans W3]